MALVEPVSIADSTFWLKRVMPLPLTDCSEPRASSNGTGMYVKPKMFAVIEFEPSAKKACGAQGSGENVFRATLR